MTIKERAIKFNDEMVRAILSGRKTQTRHAVKFPFIDRNIGCELSGNELAGEISGGNYSNCPFGKIGDLLWVRETWSTHSCFDDYKPSELGYLLSVHYWADGHLNTGKKRPSIHMPRWASRITLEITSIRIERLNAITEEDAKAEGVIASSHPVTPPAAAYRVGFANLWREICGDQAWSENPWCWVMEFKRVEEINKSNG